MDWREQWERKETEARTAGLWIWEGKEGGGGSGRPGAYSRPGCRGGRRRSRQEFMYGLSLGADGVGGGVKQTRERKAVRGEVHHKKTCLDLEGREGDGGSGRPRAHFARVPQAGRRKSIQEFMYGRRRPIQEFMYGLAPRAGRRRSTQEFMYGLAPRAGRRRSIQKFMYGLAPRAGRRRSIQEFMYGLAPRAGRRRSIQEFMCGLTS